ncbi:MAG TPA: hypothetical protein VGW58_00925 [Pyrinomonadaceae bacterium]|nr:hypothetical protein [Pyrinomonadaceae bacterium]
MKRNLLAVVNAIIITVVVVLSMTSSVAAQGRGRGGGVGGGRGSGGGQPTGVGVERGLGRSSDASVGRSDVGRGNASDRSNGRSDAGLERARLASDNLRGADRDLRSHPGLARDLHVNANDLREDYRAALAVNPDLRFGEFVAATRLAHNLGNRNPAITRSAILAGLANGDSLGRTLRNLGLGKEQANDAIRRADRQVKESKRRN